MKLIVPPIEVEGVFGLINFLRNVDAVEARLKQLEELRVALNEKIEQVAKAEQIDDLLAKTGADRAQAARDLEKAKEDAAQIVSDANEQAVATAAAVEQRAADCDRALAAREAALMQAELSSAAKIQDLADKTAYVAERERASQRLWAEAKAMKEEYDSKLSKLQAAMT